MIDARPAIRAEGTLLGSAAITCPIERFEDARSKVKVRLVDIEAEAKRTTGLLLTVLTVAHRQTLRFTGNFIPYLAALASTGQILSHIRVLIVVAFA